MESYCSKIKWPLDYWGGCVCVNTYHLCCHVFWFFAVSHHFSFPRSSPCSSDSLSDLLWFCQTGKPACWNCVYSKCEETLTESLWGSPISQGRECQCVNIVILGCSPGEVTFARHRSLRDMECRYSNCITRNAKSIQFISCPKHQMCWAIPEVYCTFAGGRCVRVLTFWSSLLCLENSAQPLSLLTQLFWEGGKILFWLTTFYLVLLPRVSFN